MLVQQLYFSKPVLLWLLTNPLRRGLPFFTFKLPSFVSLQICHKYVKLYYGKGIFLSPTCVHFYFYRNKTKLNRYILRWLCGDEVNCLINHVRSHKFKWLYIMQYWESNIDITYKLLSLQCKGVPNIFL